MARCHIKIKRNLMVALLLILRDCGVMAKNTLFKHFLRSDRPQLSSACTKNQLSNVPSEIFNLKRNRPRNLHKQICNFREQVVGEPVANCSEQTANQNTNIAAEVCKVARKRTSGLTVNQLKFNRSSCLFFSSVMYCLSALSYKIELL